MEVTVKLTQFQAKARELAGSGQFIGWRPLEFVLRFEDGFDDAQDWLQKPSTQAELDRLCVKARARRLRTLSTKAA